MRESREVSLHLQYNFAAKSVKKIEQTDCSPSPLPSRVYKGQYGIYVELPLMENNSQLYTTRLKNFKLLDLLTESDQY